MKHTSQVMRRSTALTLVLATLAMAAAARGTTTVSFASVLEANIAGPTPDGTPLATAQQEPAPPPAPEFRERAPAPLADAAPPALAAGSEKSGTEKPMEPPADAVESLRDAIVASLKANPEIQIALAQQDDARYAVDIARAAYLPHLDLTVGYGREFAKAGTAVETWRNRLEGTVTLAQTVWDFGVTTNDISRARASYRSAQWATREKIEGISYDITSAYIGVLRAEQLVDLANQEIDAYKRVLRMVTIQKDLGLTTPADVSRAQAQLDGGQSQLLDRQSALQQARLNYRRLTGHLPAHAQPLAPAASELPPQVEDAVDLIDQRSPRMAQAVEDRRSLEKQYASQTGTFFPRVSLMVQGNHKYDVMGKTGMADDARAMVQVTYNLLNGGADRATRQRISARMREADYELDRRRREVEQDIRTDFTALEAARAKIATINAEIDSATKVVDLYRQQFREGKRTVFEVLDSEKTLYAAKANQVVNSAAMNLAEYRVLQKLGGLFDLVSSHEPLPPLVRPVKAKDPEPKMAPKAPKAKKAEKPRDAAKSAGKPEKPEKPKKAKKVKAV